VGKSEDESAIDDISKVENTRVAAQASNLRHVSVTEYQMWQFLEHCSRASIDSDDCNPCIQLRSAALSNKCSSLMTGAA
jgi:hypothetical protein